MSVLIHYYSKYHVYRDRRIFQVYIGWTCVMTKSYDWKYHIYGVKVLKNAQINHMD